MRNGRLETSTLNNILMSLDSMSPNGENALRDANPRLQKQYIPTSSESPLYRLVTVLQEEDGEVDIQQSNSSFSTSQNRISINRQINVPFTTPSAAEWTNDQVFSTSTSQIEVNLPNRILRMNQSTISLQTHQNASLLSLRRSANSRTISTENVKLVQGDITDIPNIRKTDDWMKEYEHIDVDWSMQAMDVLYNASFFEYIRDERNLELSSIRLARIIKDYKPRQVQVVNSGWTVENTAKLLRSVFSDWLPDLAGCVFALISANWPKIPQLSLCTAYILLSEPASSAALFIRTLTESWNRDDTIEIISYLDNLLEWDEDYLKEMMRLYTLSISPESEIKTIEITNHGITRNQDQDFSGVDSCRKSLELARHKLVNVKLIKDVANSRLNVAEYRLALLSHWTSCPSCNGGQPCSQLSLIPVPEILDGTESALKDETYDDYDYSSDDTGENALQSALSNYSVVTDEESMNNHSNGFLGLHEHSFGLALNYHLITSLKKTSTEEELKNLPID